MSEERELTGWRKAFLANRMALESVMFTKDAEKKPAQDRTGVLVLGAICLAAVALLSQWVLRRGYLFSKADAEGFAAVLRYADFFRSEGLWSLLRPDLAGLAVDPPFYYLAYVPVLHLTGGNLNAALLVVNSGFLVLLLASVYLAILKHRPMAYGWLGAAFAAALPFVAEAARRPSPDIALAALVAAAYCGFVRYDDSASSPWNLWFAVALSLGFYTHRHFWVFALPLAHSVLLGLSSPSTRDEFVYGLLPGALLCLPWYACAGIALASGLVPLRGELPGPFSLLAASVNGAGLPLFAVGVLALIWLYFSVLNPFERRGTLIALAAVPYVVFTFVTGGEKAAVFFPALLFPLSLAAGMMTPHVARKFMLSFSLGLLAVNQGGLVPPLYFGDHLLCGLPLPAALTYKPEEVLALIKKNLPDGGLVGVYGADDSLNAVSLGFAARQSGLRSARFEDAPVCPACPQVIINRRQPRGAPPAKGGANFIQVRSRSWFAAAFEKRGEVPLADGSKVELFAKIANRPKPFEEGSYQLKGLMFGGLSIEEGTLKTSGYRPETGRYSRAEFFSPVATLSGGEIYGLTLDLSGLELAGSGSDPVLAGAQNARIASAKVTENALESFLSAKFTALTDWKVSMDEGLLALSATAGGKAFSARLTVSVPQPGQLEFRPEALDFWFLSVPPQLLSMFRVHTGIADNAYGLSFSGLRIRNRMLEFY